MLAIKVRRASDYVEQPVQVVVALAGTEIVPVGTSPARALQAELASRLAVGPDPFPMVSTRRRVALIMAAAALCWLPIVGVFALL
ncbi:MAG: hypothetical protein HC788_01860 [Sphingopyxis sp.]|nr:hypothetical protein [Sphingopyxis sp.]